MNSFTSLKLRNAWMPPAVAHAPIVTSTFRCAADLVDALGIVRRGDRAFDEREVVRAFNHGARSLDEVGDLHLVGDSK